VAISYQNKIMVFRGVGPDGKPKQVSTFADGLSQPFGIQFYPAKDPKWVYIGNTDSVVRIPYQAGDLKARGPAEKLTDLPGGGRLRGGGHWTRDIAFSKDGKKMFVSVGSHSNSDDTDTPPEEEERADVLEMNPDGSARRIYAYGIRNCVGHSFFPEAFLLWGSVNERDELGDTLPSDYITSIKDGGFYGWPF